MAEIVSQDSYQILPYLKSCLPEEGCKHLVKNRVKTLGEAMVELNCILPSRTILSELEHIRQQPGEKSCTLVTRIRGVVNKYLPYLLSLVTEEERERLIGTRFCHAI